MSGSKFKEEKRGKVNESAKLSRAQTEEMNKFAEYVTFILYSNISPDEMMKKMKSRFRTLSEKIKERLGRPSASNSAE